MVSGGNVLLLCRKDYIVFRLPQTNHIMCNIIRVKYIEYQHTEGGCVVVKCILVVCKNSLTFKCKITPYRQNGKYSCEGC